MAIWKSTTFAQEVFGCEIYPGDPAPEIEKLSAISNGDICNLSAFRMCSHNGTHVDAPYHFIDEGKTIDQTGIDTFIGFSYVAEHDGSPCRAALIRI